MSLYVIASGVDLYSSMSIDIAVNKLSFNRPFLEIRFFVAVFRSDLAIMSLSVVPF